MRLACFWRCSKPLCHTRNSSSSSSPSWRLHRHGLDSSSSSSSSLRHGMLRARSLREVRRAHAQAVVLGLLGHRSSPAANFASAFILAYSTLLDPSSSLLIFSHLPPAGNPFLHNTLVRALSISGLHAEALAVYNLIPRDGLRPDDRTFPYVLKACADRAALRKGMEVHGSVIKLGFCSDVFVANTLLSFYSASGLLLHARRVFDVMSQRDLVSWNSMISACSANGCYFDALNLFRELMAEGLLPNVVSLVSTLPACPAVQVVDGLFFGMAIQGLSVKNGLVNHVTVANAVIDFYGRCGDPDASKSVFSTMPERNDVSWNSVIGSLARAGLFSEAVGMFRCMLMDFVEKPNSVTISSLLPTLVECEHFNLAREVHGYVIRTAMDLDVFVANSLVDIYAKHGCREKASYIFYQMRSRNTVSWNTMIANLTLNGAESEAIGLVREMVDSGFAPNAVTVANALPACSRMASHEKGKEIHARSIRCGFSCSLFVSNALIDMYAKCGRLGIARRVFELSERRDQVSYNALIVGYSRGSSCIDSLLLFMEMGSAGFAHDVVSFMGALTACVNLSAIKQGKEIHCLSVRKLLHLSITNSLLDMYVNCGAIGIARKLFEWMPSKNVASWNSMIMGHGMQGEFEAATQMFDLMVEGGVEPDHVSYVAVLSACGHGGLVEKGWEYYNGMLDRNIEPTQTHYACMVDILGRAGLVEGAVEFVKNIPTEADLDVWGALLGAARLHGDLKFGRRAADSLFQQRPGSCSQYYVLLANMYAEAGRWKEANETRQLVTKKSKRMNPGCSWVEICSSEKSSSGLVVL